ncbi:NAD-dependent epimerase/dehydratase family protein [Speluncibacter jeojiensis]|uniref:NAD-dependent epimerase/dehydratase family protein n=1 Tax=Speluncibacter jeojiensis TaxID=2710754 RepID=A0A9X4LYP6_9ACTN|nr:NAD-dependent epimerase/dehydratase family protein [Corynebacteriales bacterium D3-21]
MRVAVTGATSDFGTTILPVLLADPEVSAVVGLSRRELQISHPKLESRRMDVRDPGLEEALRDCAAVVHLAFVVEEIRDKCETHDINLRGSRNVIDCAYRAGARRVVIASSVNAYGPQLRPKPVTEDVYPEGDPVRYYFHDKAEVEHYAEWWLRRHPGQMAISMLRPTYIVGPDFANDGIEQLTGPVAVFPQADEAAYQFLHQGDLADAFHRAVKADLVGPYNVGPTDWVGVRELAAMQGQRLFEVPERPAVVVANAAFRLGLTPFSGHWVTAGETVVDSSRLTAATGWRPSMSAREAAAIMILLQGKSLLRREDGLARHAACEAALAPASKIVGVDGSGLDHVQIATPTGGVHAEVHADQSGSRRGTVLIAAPPGSHARHLTPMAAEVCARGLDVVVLDLPGHGLSTGERGRAPRRAVRAALAAATAYARARFDREPVVLGARGGDGLRVPGRTRALRGRFGTAPGYRRADPLLPRTVRYDDSLGHLPRADTTADVLRLAGFGRGRR